jgi:hypothetical protein
VRFAADAHALPVAAMDHRFIFTVLDAFVLQRLETRWNSCEDNLVNACRATLRESMKTATLDIPAMVRKWSPKQRQTALAALFRESMEKKGHDVVPIVDENDETIGYLMPNWRIVEGKPDLSTPYGREIQRRIDTPEDSIPLLEINAQLDREEKRKRRRAKPQTR